MFMNYMILENSRRPSESLTIILYRCPMGHVPLHVPNMQTKASGVGTRGDAGMMLIIAKVCYYWPIVTSTTSVLVCADLCSSGIGTR